MTRSILVLLFLLLGLASATAQWRGDRGWHRGGGFDAGGLIGGMIGGVIGGAIAGGQQRPYYQPQQPYYDPVRYCMQRFRSYNPETGYFLGFDGQLSPMPMIPGLPHIDLPVQRIKRFGWKPDKPDVHDIEYKPTATRLPSAFFLDSKFIPPRLDQGDLGSCTGWATRGAVSYVRCATGELWMELSPLFAYYNGRVIENDVPDDAGCEIRDIIKGVTRFGICSAADWPYEVAKFAEMPPPQAYTDALHDIVSSYSRIPYDKHGMSLHALKNATCKGQPVVFGFTVYSTFESASVHNNGMMHMPKDSDRVLGGHAVWIVGYDDSKRMLDKQIGAFLIANSWGQNWGCWHPQEPMRGRGYFWMPYDYIANHNLADDGWSIKVVVK